jgi:hypothetical protein
MPRLIGENLSSTKLGEYGTRSSIIQVRRGEKDTGMTAPAGLPQVQGRKKYFLYVSAIRRPSPSARVTLYLKQGPFKKFLTTFSYMYKKNGY